MRGARIAIVKRFLVASASVSLLALTVSGCYWLASYEDLTSGLGEAGADGGTEPVEEAGPVVDSTFVVDSGTVVEPFCPPDAGPNGYCMDFDGIDASSLGIAGYEADAAVVTGTYVSPPSSLFVGPNAAMSGGGYNVSFPLQPTTGRLEFQMLALDLNAWITTMNMSLSQELTGTNELLNVVLSPTGAFQVQEYIQLGDGGVLQDGHPSFYLDGGADAGGWHHVILSMTVDDNNDNYFSSLTVDGQVLEDGVPLALPWVQGNVGIGVGVGYAGGGGSRFFFDNVRATFGP